MAIETKLWRIDGRFDQVNTGPIGHEDRLESILKLHPEVLGEELLVLGTQITTAFGSRIDMLALDSNGALVVVELKRGQTPREVAAQVLDYGSWVRGLGYEDIVEIFENHGGVEFEAAFELKFGTNPPEALNEDHRLLIVAAELDPSTERIVDYLVEEYGVPINAVFFSYFLDERREYLSRTWLIEPTKAEAHASRSSARRSQEPWNGRDWYVSFGEGKYRNWEDARRYGFVSGGGAKWYTQTLYSLPIGARVFASIPGTGYVGVGTVADTARPVHEFTVNVNGTSTPVLEAPLEAPALAEFATGEPHELETFVRVEWINHVPREQAYWEAGMFANQHTACRLRNKFTLERLASHFKVEE